MSDDLARRGGQDRTRIDVNQHYELRDGAKEFGVTQQQLKEAVQAVGSKEAAAPQGRRSRYGAQRASGCRCGAQGPAAGGWPISRVCSRSSG